MRKSISTAFFSMVSTLMVLGIVLMGCSEWVLFKNYFAKDRYETLDQVVNVAKRTAEYLVNSETMPQGAELDALNTKLEIIGESAEAYLFFTDRQGNVLIASDPDKLTTGTVPLDICQRANAVADPDARHYHAFGDLGGALTEKSYIAAVETIDDQSLFSGWLFLCSSGAQLTDFKQQFWSNFLMSACVMLLCASVLTRLLMRQLTDPLQKVTDAAQRFGGGDLSVRVEGVEGDGEVADLARTFNQMAENIQSNDNSRGQFMGNIAHELRTPMTTIKGFVDGILDGTIPPEMQNHYLQLVSEETGRLARLIQNMLDLSKLESGEYQVNARMFNIWETLTGVALAAEQRINDGMIELEGLTMDEKVLVYADPDLIHQVAYNLLDNAIKFTPAGGTIRFSVEKLGPEAEISIRAGHQPGGAALCVRAVLQGGSLPRSARPRLRFGTEHLQGAGQSGRRADPRGEPAGRVVPLCVHPAHLFPQPRRHEAPAGRRRSARRGGRPRQHEAGRIRPCSQTAPPGRSGCFGAWGAALVTGQRARPLSQALSGLPALPKGEPLAKP